MWRLKEFFLFSGVCWFCIIVKLRIKCVQHEMCKIILHKCPNFWNTIFMPCKPLLNKNILKKYKEDDKLGTFWILWKSFGNWEFYRWLGFTREDLQWVEVEITDWSIKWFFFVGIHGNVKKITIVYKIWCSNKSVFMYVSDWKTTWHLKHQYMFTPFQIFV